MKAKRVIAAVLTGAMAAGLTACGSGSTQTTTAAKSSTAAATKTTAAATTKAASASSGSSTGGDGEIRVAWWGSQGRHNATIEALDAYAAKNGVTFSYEYNSWSSYFETLATQSVGNDLPDILQMSTTDIINYSKNGQVIDLEKYIDDNTIDISKIGKDALSGDYVDGKLAGITTGMNTVTVAYNPDILQQAGVSVPDDTNWTFSDFCQLAENIYDKTGIPTEIPFITEARWFVEALVRSYGYDLFSTDGNSLPWANDSKVSAGVAKAMDQVYSEIQKGVFVDPQVMLGWSATEDSYIAQGKSAMSFMLSNYVGQYSKVLGKDLGMLMLPKADDGTKSGMYTNSNMYWCISSNCKDPEAAAKVINYLINDKDAAKLILTDRGISLNSDIRDMLANDDSVSSSDKATLEYLNKVSSVVKGVNPPDPANSAEAIKVLKDDFQAVCYGEASGADCMDDFVSQSASILPQK
ncbi:MAG: extracellular solute-binding protein [Ruminococcus sp.]|jgi:multiple sugar transport system substrate-binding protein